MVIVAGMRDRRSMFGPAPSPLDLDVLRASLGPSVTPPYEHALGAAPWLTAGTLTWPGGEAATVLQLWRAWAERLPASALTAVRRSEYVVSVDVALIGDPWGAAARLEPLRALLPATDTVGLAAPSVLLGRSGGAPAAVVAATAPKGALPDMHALAAARVPEGIAIGARHDRADGPALIAVGIAADAPRLHLALAALDTTLRGRAALS
jgi:hypothetical protein